MMKLPFGKENERLFFDGAMGTMLQAAGLAPGESPERWNLLYPEKVLAVHEAYLAAGADILKTNTFGANRLKMEKLGLSAREVVSRGVELAKEAVRKAGRGLVAMDIGPTGRLLEPMGDLAFRDAAALFGEMAAAGRDAGADLILIETMSDLYEAKAAVIAAKETGLPVFVTVTFDEKGRLLTGGDAAAAAVTLSALGVSALGLNCGVGPEGIRPVLQKMGEYTSLPLIANPNAGLPKTADGKIFYDVGPEAFALAMKGAAEAGGAILGGCCGTAPAHIARLSDSIRGIPLPEEARELPTAVSGGTRAVTLGRGPVLLGDRIRGEETWEIDDLVDEALAEADDGAEILGLLTELPAGEDAVREVQSMTALPLVLYADDPEKLEALLRIYNGKPLVGPVTRGEADRVFPLIKKYGGVALCLTEGEDGAPQSAEERLRAAKLLLEKAEASGIAKRDLVLDPLEQGDGENGEAALAALKLIRENLGVKTSLGASGKTPVTPALLRRGEEKPDLVFADPGDEEIRDALVV